MSEIYRSEFQNLDCSTVVAITDVEYLSSYNWVEAASPTIVVPGSPALWAPLPGTTQVKRDSGLIYKDQNRARCPDYPLEPLFTALCAMQPHFDFQSMDVVTDRSNLRKLFSFVEPTAEEQPLESFTIEIEIHENTALFSGLEASSEEFIHPGQFRGFSHEFEKSYTRQQINGSVGHHRIISYRLGSMKCVVRHKTDAYVDIGGGVNSQPSAIKSRGGPSESPPLPSPTPNTTQTRLPGKTSGLLVRREGKSVPLNCTLEIKTHTLNKYLSVQEVAPQMWLSQTQKLVRAYHLNGVFGIPEPKAVDVTSALHMWQSQNQVRLGKFVALIRRILDAVKRCGDRATVRYCQSTSLLRITSLEGKKMLPEYIYALW
ncbi:hypothetical protein GGR50DRAFT_574267 [Xylaria sp. CBS 124048]|nr:hypothetical protein GGR50DRAFT_574267 [Xylaria sp. CBS 124048]